MGGGNLPICKLALLIYQKWGLAAVIVLFMKAEDCFASWRRRVQHRVLAVEVFHTKQLHRGSSVSVLARSERSSDLSSADFSCGSNLKKKVFCRRFNTTEKLKACIRGISLGMLQKVKDSFVKLFNSACDKWCESRRHCLQNNSISVKHCNRMFVLSIKIKK